MHPILARELNAYDVLVADWVVFTRETLPSSEPKPTEAAVQIESGAAEASASEPDAPAESESSEPEGRSVKDPRDIIIEPIVSEKSYALLDAGVYTFRVDPRASKPEIHDAVEAIFGVKVIKVNTLNRQGKTQAQPAHRHHRQAARHQAGHRHPRRGRAHRTVRRAR